MTTAERPHAAPEHPSIRTHVAICLIALAVMFVMLVFRGFRSMSLVPVLVGGLGVAQRWRTSPQLFVTAVAVMLWLQALLEPHGSQPYVASQFRLPDWVLCGAVLAYVSAHYRLQSLTAFIFPPDPRRRGTQRPWPGYSWLRPSPVQVRRNPDLVSTLEMTWLVITLPLWATLAQLCWMMLPAPLEEMGFAGNAWRSLVVARGVGLGLFVASGLLSYVGQCY